MKTFTLNEFFNSYERIEGFYAIWKHGYMSHEGNQMFGFSGIVSYYSDKIGFKNCPEWLDDESDEIKLVLLQEMVL